MGEAIKAKQLAVVTNNVLGEGAALFGVLRDAKINVIASCCWEMGEEAHFWLIPEDLDTARKAIRKAGFKVLTNNVVTVDIPNKPGALANMLDRVRDAGIEIKTCYVTAATKKASLVVLATASDAKAVRAING